MIPLALTTLLVLAPAGGDVDSAELLRVVVGEVASAQIARPDPSWEPAQRDCAGLVRHAYRSAYKKLRPHRLQQPLFRDHDKAIDFADAETLVDGGSFTFVGRDERARRSVKTGDILAFRQDRGDDDVVWHLMLVVAPAGTEPRVVYHPGHPERGEPDPGVRHGLLRSLVDDAPNAWRPVVDNPSFLGFYRFTEWTR
ncbi:MAG TPA: DUF1175 family protein [Myxococcota bacterium]